MADFYDIGAEAGVVGSLLLNPQLFYLFETLKPEHFHEKTNGVLYAVVRETLESGGEDVSEFALTLRVTSNQHYVAVFDNLKLDVQDYISKVKLAGTVDEGEYRNRCTKIIDLAYKRDVVNLLNTMQYDVEMSNGSANAINKDILDTIDEFGQSYLSTTDLQPFAEYVDELWGEILETQNPDLGITGMPSVIPIFNNYFTYERGELIIIGARPKTGKSFLGLNEAWHKVESGVPVAYFDTEMSSKEFLTRLLAHITGIEIRLIKSGRLTDEQQQAVSEALSYVKSKKNFVHHYDPNWTMDKIYLSARDLKRTMGLDFLVYDYIKTGDASSLDVKEHNYLGDLTNFLKNGIAGKLNIPVLSFAQMSPNSLRLADSDKINRYASVIAYLVHKEGEELQVDGVSGGNRKFIIDYNRLGEQFEQSGGHINLAFDGNISLFKQAQVQPDEIEHNLFHE